MKLIIKPTLGGATFSVEVAADTTVAEFKEAVAAAEQSGNESEASSLRLIYRGQILKDASTIGSYGEECRPDRWGVRRAPAGGAGGRAGRQEGGRAANLMQLASAGASKPADAS